MAPYFHCVCPVGVGAHWLSGWRRADLPDSGSRRVLSLADNMNDGYGTRHHETLHDDDRRKAVVDRRAVAWVEGPVVATPQVRTRPIDTFVVGEHIHGSSALWLTRGTDRRATEAVPLVAGDSRFGLCPTPAICCGPAPPCGAYRSLIALTTGVVLSRDELEIVSGTSLLLERLLDLPFRMHYGEALRLAAEDIATLDARDGAR